MQAGYNATARHNYGVGYYLQREEKRQVRIIQKVIQVLCFQKKVIQVLCFQKKKKKKKRSAYLPTLFFLAMSPEAYFYFYLALYNILGIVRPFLATIVMNGSEF